jgi:hypothetical protein
MDALSKRISMIKEIPVMSFLISGDCNSNANGSNIRNVREDFSLKK